MGLSGVGGPNMNNVQGISGNQPSQSAGKAPATPEMPSSSQARGELENKSTAGSVQPEASLKLKMLDGSFKSSPAAEKSSLLTPISPSDVKSLAERVKGSEQDQTIGKMAATTYALALLRKLTKE